MNTCGRLSIGGHHGNRLRCIVYFSTNTCICSCKLFIPNRNSNVPGSSAVTMEIKIEKSGFQEIAGIFR